MIPESIIATLVSLVGIRPARKLLPLDLDRAGPLRGRATATPATLSDSPRRFDPEQAASHLTLVHDADASEAPEDVSPDASQDASNVVSIADYWHRVDDLKLATTPGFIRWARTYGFHDVCEWRGFYGLYLEYCEFSELRPMSERSLQNDIAKRPEIKKSRPPGERVNGKVHHRPFLYEIKAQRAKRYA